MRLWHYRLLPYLPREQLVSQWRECVCIAKDVHDNGTPNHILVNYVTEYSSEQFMIYAKQVMWEMESRGYSVSDKSKEKLRSYTGCDFPDYECRGNPFEHHHNWYYLRICMANLMEKLNAAENAAGIHVLCDGYKEITNEIYKL